jgi:hypothetical protein
MISVHILVVLQIVASAALILVGSLVEAYGYGLSLGTSWPYRSDILRLALQGDPEAWHRIIATLLGLNAVVIAILLRSVDAVSGLALSAATALLGVATLNVLAGKAPAFLHGLHAVLAYATLCAYVFQVAPGVPSLWAVFERSAPLHGFLLMVFLGGMVTGQRGFQKPIGAFVVPRTGGQVAFAAHFLGWLIMLLAVAWFLPHGSVTLLLALLQGLLGFALYQSVNQTPARPGILAVLHQGMALFILFSLMFAWKVPIPHTG